MTSPISIVTTEYKTQDSTAKLSFFGRSPKVALNSFKMSRIKNCSSWIALLLLGLCVANLSIGLASSWRSGSNTFPASNQTWVWTASQLVPSGMVRCWEQLKSIGPRVYLGLSHVLDRMSYLKEKVLVSSTREKQTTWLGQNTYGTFEPNVAVFFIAGM